MATSEAGFSEAGVSEFRSFSEEISASLFPILSFRNSGLRKSETLFSSPFSLSETLASAPRSYS